LKISNFNGEIVGGFDLNKFFLKENSKYLMEFLLMMSNKEH